MKEAVDEEWVEQWYFGATEVCKTQSQHLPGQMKELESWHLKFLASPTLELS